GLAGLARGLRDRQCRVEREILAGEELCARRHRDHERRSGDQQLLEHDTSLFFVCRAWRRREDNPAKPLLHPHACYLSSPATLSSPACTHGSSTPGEPDRPPPPITSSPTLMGSPPGIAITCGNVTCWRTTGSLSANRLA